MGAAALLDVLAVAGLELDACERHVEEVGGDLREHGLVALSGRLRPADHFHLAIGLDGEHDALVGRADRRLDVIGDADAA